MGGRGTNLNCYLTAKFGRSAVSESDFFFFISAATGTHYKAMRVQGSTTVRDVRKHGYCREHANGENLWVDYSEFWENLFATALKHQNVGLLLSSSVVSVFLVKVVRLDREWCERCRCLRRRLR